MFKVGTDVVFLRVELNKDPVIEYHTVTKIGGRDYCWCDGAHKSEDCWVAAFLYPATNECIAFLEKEMEMILRHRQEVKEHMTATYQLNNKLVLAGLK